MLPYEDCGSSPIKPNNYQEKLHVFHLLCKIGQEILDFFENKHGDLKVEPTLGVHNEAGISHFAA